MTETFISKGTWFYIASWNQEGDSGLSIIILGFGIAWTDNPYNPRRHEWVIPRNAWDNKL